ncbi:hypothetical protein HDU83_007137 [Entophlyctis luteolus]|nr:hypothetical protein HDU83_007137 [Entophlyctis luteolus]KAJ3390007.1 hypothetical protein HDU84_008066 [Entophlyctis sp. JEL0112]
MLRSTFLLGAALLASALTAPPPGAVVVSQTNVSGSYSSVQSAVNSLPSTGDAVIFIYAGYYNEQVYITRSGKLTIYGYAPNNGTSYEDNHVTIAANVSAVAAGGDDPSGTLRVHKNYFNILNVNVLNTFNTATAIAVSYYGTEIGTYGCQFVAFQDTLLTETGMHYFKYSYIEGAIDYIFGQYSQAYFEQCTMASTRYGYITASGRNSATDPGAYVFDNCTVVAAATAANGTVGNVYLGRPWRPFARVVYMNSYLSDVINPAGWHEWTAGVVPVNASFFEYDNTGAGAWNCEQRVDFSYEISDSEAANFTLSALFSGVTSWILPL